MVGSAETHLSRTEALLKSFTLERISLGKKSMVVPFNDLSRNWIATSKEVHDVSLRVLKSGSYIHGPEHADFEVEFADFLGVRHAMGVASGTDALEIALRAIGCEKGSKIVSVANAGGYTSIVAHVIGCEVIYCDVDPSSLVVTDHTVAALLSSDIKAVVVTHLYGNIAPIDKILVLCAQYGITVIEDCAQAIGGTLNGKSVGTFGDIAAFSFYPTKNLGAAGDGGMIVTNNDFFASSIRELRQYGWHGKYIISRLGGMNSRLDELQAAILRIGLSKVSNLNTRRRDIIRSYQSALLGTDVSLSTSLSEGSVAHLAVLRIPSAQGRDEIRDYLEARGIGTEIHYPTLDCDQGAYSQKAVTSSLPESRKAQTEILSIPCFPEMTQTEVSMVISALHEAME